ncbi:MAG TPA: nucleotidyltransferase domain-containing protein [Rubrobacteraceae bacterium]|nr:nucleotidyltransferase domain-containing protein [Rubrobacteraceae bacterium]
MDEARHEVFELADRISDRLAEIAGVEAVALGGSWARGEAHPDSDVDLGIYYRSGSPPRIEELRRLARELDDRHPDDSLTDFGGWGPGSTTVDGSRSKAATWTGSTATSTSSSAP